MFDCLISTSLFNLNYVLYFLQTDVSLFIETIVKHDTKNENENGKEDKIENKTENKYFNSNESISGNERNSYDRKTEIKVEREKDDGKDGRKRDRQDVDNIQKEGKFVRRGK